MLERTIESTVAAYAKKQGWLTYKFTSPANKGVPDRLFIRDGFTLYVEFKQKGKEPSPLQAHTIKQMRQHGAVVLVIDSVEQGKAALDGF